MCGYKSTDLPLQGRHPATHGTNARNADGRLISLKSTCRHVLLTVDTLHLLILPISTLSPWSDTLVAKYPG